MVPYDLKWSEMVKGKLCSATKLLNKVSALVINLFCWHKLVQLGVC